MVRSLKIDRQRISVATNGKHARGSLDAEIIIANAPDPVFVSDLEGKILQANDAVSELLGFRPDELLEQSLSRFISSKEKREFTAALRAVVEHGVTRNAVLHPRSASGEVIPATLHASALRDPDSGQVIGAIGILRDMRELDKARAYAESLIKNAPDPVFVSDLEGKILQVIAPSAWSGFRRDNSCSELRGRRTLRRLFSTRRDRISASRINYRAALWTALTRLCFDRPRAHMRSPAQRSSPGRQIVVHEM